MSRISGKVALITGAAQGFGKAFSEALLLRGAKVCMADINTNLGQRTFKELSEKYGSNNCDFVPCDVSQEEQLKAFFQSGKERFSKVDIVCNNAGILHETQWEKMLDINLIAMMRGTYLGIDCMAKDKGGQGGVIVNVSSAAGLTFVPFTPAYTASKHGIIAFSKSLALHPFYLKHKVRINCLCPFFAKTDIINVDESQVMGMKLAKRAIQAVGVLPVEEVVEGFLELVENPAFNGECLVLTKHKKKFAEYPKTGFEGLTEEE